MRNTAEKVRRIKRFAGGKVKEGEILVREPKNSKEKRRKQLSSLNSTSVAAVVS